MYRTGSRRFLKFCETYQVFTPFPVSERTLSAFVAHLHKGGLAPGTVKSYLAAVRYVQIAQGFGDPRMGDMPQLEYVVKGMKRTAPPRSGRTRLPITPEILVKLKRVWATRKDRRVAAMLWAAACMCFFGFLRTGEVVTPSDSSFDSSTHLTYCDVRVDNVVTPQYLEVKIKASKTDPFRQGVSVCIGVAAGDLCPVAAILDYMVRRGPVGGPFFLFQDGKFLTRDRFVAEMREALTLAGFDPTLYAGHSFRIGAATTAAQRGLPDSLIKTLGRWRSSAYTVYIRTPRDTLCAVTGLLARSSAEQ